jgi:hypothetical protein
VLGWEGLVICSVSFTIFGIWLTFCFLQDSSRTSLKRVIDWVSIKFSSEAKAVYSMKANLLCLVVGTSSSVLHLSSVS